MLLWVKTPTAAGLRPVAAQSAASVVPGMKPAAEHGSVAPGKPLPPPLNNSETFGARTADHTKKLNKKIYRRVLRCILSQLIRNDRLVAGNDFGLDSHKTAARLPILYAGL